MILNDHQRDVLAELINIAFARTASSLSDLTGHRVLIDVPEVDIHPIGELNRSLASVVHGDIATVHQIFGGPVAGDALLVLGYDGAVTLTKLLSNVDPQPRRLDTASREVLTEVGNILLNACLGIFGDLLQVHVSFSVPRLHVEELNALLHSIMIGKEELQYALVIYTAFQLQDTEVTGYLVIILGVTSLDRLLHAVETLG